MDTSDTINDFINHFLRIINVDSACLADGFLVLMISSNVSQADLQLFDHLVVVREGFFFLCH